MAPWPHVQFKASRSLRIQWPFNCCTISLLSWHWSILKHLPWNSVLSRPWRSIHRWSGLPLIHVNFGGPIEAKAGCFWKMLKVQFYHFIYVLVCLFKYTVHVCIYIHSCMDISILMYRLYRCEGKTSCDNTTTASPDGVGTRIFHTASGWRDKAEDRMKNVISFMGRYWKWCLVSA